MMSSENPPEVSALLQPLMELQEKHGARWIVVVRSELQELLGHQREWVRTAAGCWMAALGSLITWMEAIRDGQPVAPEQIEELVHLLGAGTSICLTGMEEEGLQVEALEASPSGRRVIEALGGLEQLIRAMIASEDATDSRAQEASNAMAALAQSADEQ